MRKILLLIFIMFLLLNLVLLNQSAAEEKIRPAARAGHFYPASKAALEEMIRDLLSNTKLNHANGRITGLWAPHAGYVFSGQIAANAYRQVKGNEYDAVIIIGPSHYVRLTGASIGDWTAYETPLGKVPVDTALVKQIRSASDLIQCIPRAHLNEHSVEAQIPFIQTVLPGIPIVPMVIGQPSFGDLKVIAKSIADAIDGRNILLVASSDMSHFPNYQDAYEADLEALDAVATFDPRYVIRINDYILKKNIPGLECLFCGLHALNTVMMVTKEMHADGIKILPYANSGDVSGERNRVVGYGAAVFYKKNSEIKGGRLMPEDIQFSKDEKNKLLRIARESILAALPGDTVPDFVINEANLQLKRGVFVTLMNHGRLRGCIGHFGAEYPLYQIVSQMAVAAATQDYRFHANPVRVQEMESLTIKISVLSELQKIKSIDEIEIGKHGIWITQGNRSGTYLPEVATELGWNKIEFLEHCCVEKAGLSPDAWKKGADIYIYSSQILSENEG